MEIFGGEEQFAFNIRTDIPVEELKNAGMVIAVNDGYVEISLNKNKTFRVLEKRKLIIAALNKKLDELVEKKIQATAKDEDTLEKER
jgi:uncharacterized protein YwgA